MGISRQKKSYFVRLFVGQAQNTPYLVIYGPKKRYFSEKYNPPLVRKVTGLKTEKIQSYTMCEKSENSI